MSPTRRRYAVVLAACLAVGTLVPAAAEAATPTIHPGIRLVTGEVSCTANFLFADAAGHNYLGQAANCSSTGEATDTDGCSSPNLALGTPVQLGATGARGTLAYSSWAAMAKARESDENACLLNDFALVRIPDTLAGAISPDLPGLGAPTSVRTGPLTGGEPLTCYGASELLGDPGALATRPGVALESDPSGWAHTILIALPGIPGDAGAGCLDARGAAVGVVTTLALAPVPGSNGATDLDRALRYAQEHSGLPGLRLVTSVS